MMKIKLHRPLHKNQSPGKGIAFSAILLSLALLLTLPGLPGEARAEKEKADAKLSIEDYFTEYKEIKALYKKEFAKEKTCERIEGLVERNLEYMKTLKGYSKMKLSEEQENLVQRCYDKLYFRNDAFQAYSHVNGCPLTGKTLKLIKGYARNLEIPEKKTATSSPDEIEFNSIIKAVRKLVEKNNSELAFPARGRSNSDMEDVVKKEIDKIDSLINKYAAEQYNLRVMKKSQEEVSRYTKLIDSLSFLRVNYENQLTFTKILSELPTDAVIAKNTKKARKLSSVGFTKVRRSYLQMKIYKLSDRAQALEDAEALTEAGREKGLLAPDEKFIVRKVRFRRGHRRGSYYSVMVKQLPFKRAVALGAYLTAEKEEISDQFSFWDYDARNRPNRAYDNMEAGRVRKNMHLRNYNRKPRLSAEEREYIKSLDLPL